jgi:general secretion pathway protein D
MQTDVVELGSGSFIGADTSAPLTRIASEKDGIVLNFQNADVQEVVKAILGEMLGVNYIIEQGVSGTVTTETSGGLARADLLTILEMLLRQSQAALIKEGDLYRIVPLATSLKGGLSPRSRQNGKDGAFGMQIIALRYIAVGEMQKILAPLLVDGALIYADEKRNLLILAGSQSEQRRYLETISVFDVDWMNGMSTGLFQLDHVAPEDLKKELVEALGDESGKLLDGLVRLVALDRLGALLAISASRRAITEIQSWVLRLDVPSDTAEPRLYVFRLQNAKAVEVAAILSDVFAESGGRRDRGPDLAPGLKPVTVASPGETDRPQRAPPATPGNAGLAVRVGENVRIIPDETNNGLVIMATPREYELIASAIKKLDLIPLQVLIEATIIEVTLGDSLEYGVEWFFKNGVSGNKQGQGLLDLGSAGIGTLVPAFSYTIIDSAGQVRAAINALATESEVSILSSPSLMVLDNQTATINVGDEIPIPTRSSVSNVDPNAPTVNEIEYRNTGVTLQVTPRVNAGGLVTMEVDQEVSDAVGTTSSDLNAPTIQQRKITSTVAVQSGETIVLGGLIRDSATQSESGIPYLRNIPGLGKLFSQTNDTTRRTELIVLITPRAVDSDESARDVTREYSEKMQNFDRKTEFELRY